VLISGCGAAGEAGIREGKLAWKVEFAARWKALDIHFEAYGKDILDSVRCNDAISREILGREPPVHSFYELFTERGGKKLSKSKGNVFTPQMWMEVASPESLRLLFLKRLGTSRVVDPDAIPALMDEVDELSRVYFQGGIRNERELAHKKRLFEYVHLLAPPRKPGLSIEYNSLVTLAQSLPVKDKMGLIKKVLLSSGKVGKLDKSGEKELEKRIGYAIKWGGDEKPAPAKLIMNRAEKKALVQLEHTLKEHLNGDEIQDRIFTIARERGIKPQKFFGMIYRILLGLDRGPKAGHLIELLGRERVRMSIKKYV
jgi:lysyl-tRNA synthetase class 1